MIEQIFASLQEDCCGGIQSRCLLLLNILIGAVQCAGPLAIEYMQQWPGPLTDTILALIQQAETDPMRLWSAISFQEV
jgi:hypothetical protein